MYSSGAPPLPPGRPPQTAQQQQQQVVPADFQVQQPLWRSGVLLRQHLRELVEHAALLKAVAAELEVFENAEPNRSSASTSVESASVFTAEVAVDDVKDVVRTEVLSIVPFQRTDDGSATQNEHSVSSLASVSGSESVAPRAELLAAVQASGRVEAQTVEAALELQKRVTSLLAPLEGALGAPGGWEHAAAAARLRSKREKIQRNRKWRKRKRQRVADARRKEQEGFEEADRKVDEWRAREIAKSIARAKMEKMKVLAEQKAKEDRTRLAAELEMVLMVEKLQELRALRIQKLKKQGRFFPDEDDKFMERVRAAVEEEERQAAAAADTRATAAAIASAAEAAKGTGQVSAAFKADGDKPNEDQPEIPSEGASDVVVTNSADQNVVKAPINSSSAQSADEEKVTAVQEAYKLPAEFYYFYYGSQLDLGALIEVRRAWDAYLMPGGSRIPGHWIEPPPPADAVWASYLVRPPSKTETAAKGKAEPKAKKRRKNGSRN
ncbi:hypothetical protein M758_4G008000 [Ceratodon purpureus]|nr:hypothetical protein M758_4G008000 [Ceratodon purpureus]